jgi:uncharacterized PurR-regulated membrane protein YhhQ (DUF165 family)
MGRRGWGVVSIFESGVRARAKTGGQQFVSGSAASRGARQPAGRAGKIVVAPQPNFSQTSFGETALAFARLVFPILLLVTAGAWALIYGNHPAAWLGARDVGGAPLDAGFAALPITFLIVQLTNRRYGAGYASLQVLGAVAASIAAAIYARDTLTAMRGAALPPMRLMLAFGGGLFLAQFVSILVFDRLRGPRWWQAPLFASLLAGATLSLVGFGSAYSGTGADWVAPMMSYLYITIEAAVLLLIPYWLLRPVIAPMSGFGGY